MRYRDFGNPAGIPEVSVFLLPGKLSDGWPALCLYTHLTRKFEIPNFPIMANPLTDPLYKTTETPNATSPSQLGPQYQSLIDANPYRNQTYQVSPWQAFLKALGFRTQADAWKENMAVQAAEYDASIAQKAYDESYNTPAMQAERMRAAGLNPDIDGGSSISSGEAASPAQDPSTPMQSTGDDAQLGSFLNNVLSSVSTAVGLVQSFQGIEARSLQNQVERFRLQGDIAGYAEKMLPYMIPDSPNPAGMVNSYDWRGETLRRAQRFSKKLPRKTRQAFLDHIEQFWDSAPADSVAFEAFLKRATSRKAYYQETSHNYSEFDDELKDIFEPIGELIQWNTKRSLEIEKKGYEVQDDTLDTQKDNNQTQRAENAERREYLATHDAAAEGAADNAGYKARTSSTELQDQLKSTILKITNRLAATGAKGGMEGFFADLILMIMSMNSEGMIPKF